MKGLADIVNKQYDKKLCNIKSYKHDLAEIKKFLKENDVLCDGKSDIDCIQYEILASSLKVKQQFEAVFFDTYVKMYDYWYTLTYQERKKQMNVEIDKLKETLSSFPYEDELIYMPCFDAKFNHLYHTEIVLLDLKQYHAFIREFQKEIKLGLYGCQAFQHGFTKCEVMALMEDAYVLYRSDIHRFYLYEHHTYQSTFSIDPKIQEVDPAQLRECAMLLLLQREEDLANTLLEGALVQDSVKKKISKFLKKRAKKAKKNT